MRCWLEGVSGPSNCCCPLLCHLHTIEGLSVNRYKQIRATQQNIGIAPATPCSLSCHHQSTIGSISGVVNPPQLLRPNSGCQCTLVKQHCLSYSLCVMALCFRWVPAQERSRSLAFVYSGMFLGSIFGLSLSPHMIQLLSWPSVFYAFGAVGIGWFLAWQSLAGSNPKEDVFISDAERDYILENSSTQASVLHNGNCCLHILNYS